MDARMYDGVHKLQSVSGNTLEYFTKHNCTKYFLYESRKTDNITQCAKMQKLLKFAK